MPSSSTSIYVDPCGQCWAVRDSHVPSSDPGPIPEASGPSSPSAYGTYGTYAASSASPASLTSSTTAAAHEPRGGGVGGGQELPPTRGAAWDFLALSENKALVSFAKLALSSQRQNELALSSSFNLWCRKANEYNRRRAQEQGGGAGVGSGSGGGEGGGGGGGGDGSGGGGGGGSGEGSTSSGNTSEGMSLKLKDDPKYAKYFKMLKMGLPVGAVQNRMEKDGEDPAVMEMDPEGPSPSAKEDEVDGDAMKLKDDPKYVKYFKMLKMGLPVGAVQNRMEKDGEDPAVMDMDPEGPSPAAAEPAADAMKLKDDPKYVKYFKMLKMGLPMGAVQNRMEKDGEDPTVMEMDPEGPSPSPAAAEQSAPAMKLKDDPKYEKYFKMLKMGLPVGAVQNRMAKDGEDPAVMEMDPEGPSPSAKAKPKAKKASAKGSAGLKKKAKAAKPGPPKDGLIRKKVHWRKLPKKMLEGSIWSELSTSGARAKTGEDGGDTGDTGDTGSSSSAAAVVVGAAPPVPVFKFDKQEDRELKALFCINVKKLGDDGKEKAGGAGGGAGGGGAKAGGGGRRGSTSGRKPLTQLLDVTRANNIAIVLKRFSEHPLSKPSEVLCSMDPSGLSVENLRSLFGLAPTKDEVETLSNYKGPRDNATLGVAERWCMEIMKVPRYLARIRCFLYKADFDDAVQDVTQDLEILHTVVKGVRASKGIRDIMRVALALGNFLNHGSSSGDAMGITLDSLNKLKNVKSYGSKTTALHYLALVIKTKYPEGTKVGDECGDCRAAANVILSALQGDVKALQNGIKSLEMERTRVEEDLKALDAKAAGGTGEAAATGPDGKTEGKSGEAGAAVGAVAAAAVLDPGSTERRFHKAISRFLVRANDVLKDTVSQGAALQHDWSGLRQYFGETDTMTPADLFKQLHEFIDSFHVALEENEAAKQKALKRARAKRRAANLQKLQGTGKEGGEKVDLVFDGKTAASGDAKRKGKKSSKGRSGSAAKKDGFLKIGSPSKDADTSQKGKGAHKRRTPVTQDTTWMAKQGSWLGACNAGVCNAMLVYAMLNVYVCPVYPRSMRGKEGVVMYDSSSFSHTLVLFSFLFPAPAYDSA